MANDFPLSLEEAGKRTRAQKLGPQPGRLYRLQKYDNLGAIRPFGPGEYLHNPDGSMSNEETLTVQRPDGKWMIVPGLWMVNGQAHKVDDDQALQYAQQSGLIWPTFENQNWANQFAGHREAIWERTPQGQTDAQPPLWSRPLPGYDHTK
jgi:hypothetical protein